MSVLKVSHFTLIFAGQWSRDPCASKKYCGSRAGTTEAAAIESVRLRLRRLVGVARGPLWRGVRLEAIGPIG